MDAKPQFVPTEAQLKKLKFKESERRRKFDFEHDCGICFSEKEGFLIECFDGSYGIANIYPKSLEELRTLIAMMKP